MALPRGLHLSSVRNPWLRIAIVAGLLLAGWVAEVGLPDFRGGADGNGGTGDTSEATADNTTIVEAYRSGTSNVVVEGVGTVERLLGDDVSGSRHQRFILRVAPDHTVLVSHNIDLAERVQGLAAGDRVEFRGEYEWNDRGGVVHWTHHDPQGARPGGWLRHRGRTVR